MERSQLHKMTRARKRALVSKVVTKEEQLDFPPGFNPEPEMRCGDAITSSLSVAAFDGGDLSDCPTPIEAKSVPMQNPVKCFMQQDNSAENCMKRKRKPREFPGHETLPFPKRCRPCALEPLPQAYGSDSLFDFNPTIDAIKAKHGDIDKYCNLKSKWMRKLNLFCICNVLKELQKKRLDELDIVSLEYYYDVVRDVEKLNIDVKWLLERLDEIKDAIRSRDEAKLLADEKEECMKKLEEKRKQVDRLNNEIQNLQDLYIKISNRASKFQKFQSKPLVDGLI